MISLSNKEFVDLKLPFTEEPKSICIVGNTIGFFGAFIENKISMSDSHPRTINDNLAWLLNEVGKGSKFFIIGDKNTIKYYTAVFKLAGGCYQKKVCWQSVNINKIISKVPEYTMFADNPNAAYVKVLEELYNRKMKFNQLIMNPPYMQGLGGKIVYTAHKSFKDADFSVLMPISNYKTDDLYTYISEIEIADPALFEDADITKGLCICKLVSKQNTKSFLEIEMNTYDKNFEKFYRVNYSLPKKYTFERQDYAKPEDFDFDRDYVDMNRLVNWDTGFMNGGTGQGYIWNVARRKEIKTAGVVAIRFETPKGRENFTTWAYSDVKNGLANKLMWGLNKQTTSSLCYIAIPQVDWENIQETDLWKNKDYDGAVLKEMGLKWSEDRNAVDYI